MRGWQSDGSPGGKNPGGHGLPGDVYNLLSTSDCLKDIKIMAFDGQGPGIVNILQCVRRNCPAQNVNSAS